MVEKKKAERPKPDKTMPVAVALFVTRQQDNRLSKQVELTALSGKLFAVAFTELTRPPFPPAPVINVNITSSQNIAVG